MAITERLSSALADRYRIVRHLGAGGMANVYLAEDLKHDRQVAIKVLKPELAAVLGAERFVVEIKTTAALQHPHILPLFDSGTADGFLFYVMPFIEGETIRDRLNRETQLGVDEAVRLTREVADALDYAHRRGIIHRDVKPENVLLHDGRALVMDFGIALAVSAAAGGRMTETGLSLGTPHYMSPEQATADKEISPRSDVYSLASVLYEMLSGQPPHLGGSAQQIIMKIITEPAAPVTQHRKTVPPHVAAALARALEKLPADRFTTAREFADALGSPGFTHATAAGVVIGGAGAGAGAAGRRGRWVTAALALVAVAATGAAVWPRLSPAPTPAPIRLDLALGGSRLWGNDVVVSPDGTMLVYAGVIESGTAIFLRRLRDDTDFRMLAGTERGTHPTFSPDSKWIMFSRGGEELMRVSVDGGAIQQVARDPQAFNPHWGRPDQIVYSGPLGTYLRSLTDGSRRELRGLGGRRPFLLPDGSGVLGLSSPDVVALYDLRTDSLKDLVKGAIHPVYVDPGVLLFDDEQGGLSAVRFDLSSHTVTGRPVRLLDGVASAAGARGYSVSATGVLVHHEGKGDLQAAAQTRLVMVRMSGAKETLPLDGLRMVNPRLSPDGRRLLYSGRSDREPLSQLFLYDLQSRSNTQVTFGGTTWIGAWSPDGRRIAYMRDSGKVNRLEVRDADLATPAMVLMTTESRGQRVDSWEGDSALLLNVNGTGNSDDIVRVPVRPGARAQPVLASGWSEVNATISPDGRLIAHTSFESGERNIWVVSSATPGTKWRVSRTRSEFPRWSRDGRYLYYWSTSAVAADTLIRVAVTAGNAPTFGPPELVLHMEIAGAPPWDLHPDGQRFIAAVPTTPGDGAGPASGRTQTRFRVVLNWFTALRAALDRSEAVAP